ncbi:MAG: hypothetical protein IH984_14945 [Planctomycetes bacterium]|nr:hypothetical protein [Planctomycetota bacterium]
MRPKTNLITILAFSAVTLLGQSTTLADDFEWIADGRGEWTDAENWKKTSGKSDRTFPNHISDSATIIGPGQCEIVPTPIAGACLSGCNLTIRAGATLRVSTCLTIKCKLTIEPNGTLLINSNATVELTRDNANHEIGGYIKLTGSGATLLISGDATLDPFTPPGHDPQSTFGKIQGLNNDACIAICNGKTLTNNITICGMMTIKSTICGSTTAGGETASAADSKVSENISAEKLKKKLQKNYRKTTVKTTANTAVKTAVNTALKTEVNCALNTALKCSYKQTMRLAQKTTTSSVICDI